VAPTRRRAGAGAGGVLGLRGRGTGGGPDRGQPGEAGLPAAARAALIHTAYDLRAPLTAVIGFAERIRSGAAMLKPTETIAHSADIVAAAWRLVRLAEDLETAGTSGDTSPDLRMGEVDIARRAAPAAEAAGVTFNGHGLPERGKAPLVIADESALWSVIDSLLQNAVRHAGRGAAVAITFGKPDHGLALEIADNGPGLDSEALAGILEGGNRGDGAGHGLAFCRELVRANGAELQIETAPGQGLTARLVFPATNVMTPRAEAAMASGLGSRPSLGYPGDRYEMGLEAIEQIEVIAAELAAEVFQARHAEIRVPSGAVANLYALHGLLQARQRGDRAAGIGGRTRHPPRGRGGGALRPAHPSRAGGGGRIHRRRGETGGDDRACEAGADQPRGKLEYCAASRCRDK